jgi:DNA replicative helicase MCM subunit Mcm2 (Cdc46/Mcm family)
MLNSDERRPAFDDFFRSLDEDARTVFLADAVAQWQGIQDSEIRTVSLIDCLENIWDAWREMLEHPDERLSQADRAIKIVVNDETRRRLEAEYRALRSE